MHDLLDLLLAADPDSVAARTVADAFEAYSGAVGDQFELLEPGRVAEAEKMDEQRVDPAFDGLAEALAAAARYYGAVAREANWRSDLGTVFPSATGLRTFRNTTVVVTSGRVVLPAQRGACPTPTELDRAQLPLADLLEFEAGSFGDGLRVAAEHQCCDRAAAAPR
jgi:hypothetical protein